MSEQFVHQLEQALAQNPECRSGLFVRNRAFVVDRGPSGGPEALALILADDLFGDRFYYGHAFSHPNTKGQFVALLCWSSVFINADNVPLLFRRYHHWTMVNPHYEPCTIQAPDDAFSQCTSFASAVTALAEMVKRFD